MSDFNMTADTSGLDATLPFNNFIELSRFRAENKADKTAFTFLNFAGNESFDEHRLNYAELDRKARNIAAHLQQCVEPKARVILIYPSGCEFITALFGCFYAGVIAVPVYPPNAKSQWPKLIRIAEDCQASAICTLSAQRETVAEGLASKPELSCLPCLATDTFDGTPSPGWHAPFVNENDIAFLQYTSGTTGSPHGVMISHGNLIHNQRMIKTALNHSERSVGVSWLPLYHDMGLIGSVLHSFYCDFPMYFMSPAHFLRAPIRWLKTISDFKGTSSAAPNFAYDLCVNRITQEQKKDLDLSHWENAFNGAENVRNSTLEKFADYFSDCGFRREAFTPGYGLAEATVMVTSSRKDRAPSKCVVSASALERYKLALGNVTADDSKTIIGCGYPAGQRVFIVNPENCKICSADEIGEIWVQGPNVAQGYWNKKNLTYKTFNAYTSEIHEGPFLRTGDLGFLENGELYVTGRIKELIIIRGRNHYPQDIESAAQASHPILRQGWGAAFMINVNNEERAVLVQEVIKSCSDNIALEKAAASIRLALADQQSLELHDVVLIKQGRLPSTSSGKICRHLCSQEYLDGTLPALYSISNHLDS